MDISEVRNLVKQDGIVFLSYGGFLSQGLISAMTEALEKETENNDISVGIANNIFTIFIELSQNMMNYSKDKIEFSEELKAEGLIIVCKDEKNDYRIDSQNIINKADRDKIEATILDINSLDRDGVKKRYRELRKSGKNTHGKGGGIGFYEIAKRCEKIECEFTKINEDKLYFHFTSYIKSKKG